MLTDKEKAEKWVELKKLVRQWTRAEIMARHGFSRGMEFGDYAMKEIELRNQIREELFGSSNLVELGEEWGLLKSDAKR
jgi:hypothetical protein